VPLICHLQQLGHKVIVAGNESQRAFLKNVCEGVNLIQLDGYDITYSKWNQIAQAGLLAQLPSICKSINEEHKWLVKLIAQRRIDGIISDNRYGLCHERIPSVMMTHQLMVQTGFGNLADRAIQRIHYKMIQRFNNTWIVDIPGKGGLSGALSHPLLLPKKCQYIGLLSGFAAATVTTEMDKEVIAPLLILLSGPEPQRSELARLLWGQALAHPGPVIFIEGTEMAITPEVIPQHITYHKRLTHATLAPLLHEAGMVICRSGYSTLMDLAALGKKAILIPTPGQTEQEYLARYLHKEGKYYTVRQQGFNLTTTLAAARQFPYLPSGFQRSYNMYRDIVSEWAEAL
jgi:hypothetical protein